MDKIKEILKYIKLYTDCDDTALTRIKAILDKHFIDISGEPIIFETKYIKVSDKKPTKPISEFAKQYMLINNVEYTILSKKSRERKYVHARVKFCTQAFLNGYGYTDIAKYLGFHHSTIMHSINNIKK